MQSETNMLLNEIKKLNEALHDKDNINSLQKKKKRKKGSFRLFENGNARLEYMYCGERFSENVEASSEEEAERKLAIFVQQIEKGTYVNANYTFTEFAQIWLDKKVRPNSDEYRVVPKYKSYLNNRILPELGHIKLKNLTRQKLEDYFNKLKKSKTIYAYRTQQTTLKPGTVTKIRKIINAILNYAVECDLLVKNPCKGIKIKFTYNTSSIKNENELIALSNKNKISYYTIEEYKLVCSLLEKEFNEFYINQNLTEEKKHRELARRLFILLDLKTGMRRSELFGLARGKNYNDLDIENKTFTVNKTRHYAKDIGRYTKETKNQSSERTKSLPSSIITYIEKYYKYLDDINYKNIYIFENLSIDGICSWWDKWQDKNNIKNIRLHDIRHTHPTILLYLGVDMKTISERLGHADIQTTFNIYADVLKELDIEASNKIDDI